jgi:hypothetical protein
MEYRIFESRSGLVAVDISNMSIGEMNRAVALLRNRWGVVTKCIGIGINGHDVKKVFHWDKEKNNWDVSPAEEEAPGHQRIAA